jgi:hypothetical protein
MSKMFKHLFHYPLYRRQLHLAKGRNAIDESGFVGEIVEKGGDYVAAVSLWKRLNECKTVDHLTPYPTDSLETVYGLADEDLDDDLVLDLFKELRVPVPSTEVLHEFGQIDTPLQVAQLVARCRTQ